ncbi:pyridoxamine 5'-phosphate oxidase [Mycolicibacterium sp. (ex Dasyatis americana)]|nr:pyridoxamine 5'-phosphate oxidase family protein [Mycolicibacterium fortuitum]OFB40528.1 pyridoxamine 5'-phosphate oxidase [Mycolicibacterium sp. (ex Dasyatis americana)]MCV7139823.1 pyridoxamine 5'-phosphate oxidase family protein [Mycolicibacterium fortuitum]OBB09140.1 pyridoxamine 5'-phosphate oxidase [Mycolicibacterium fortuitum]OBK10739.1 pyridoxamine 5'-phosphate oxidase [Mycolicibacterium fortuitum]
MTRQDSAFGKVEHVIRSHTFGTLSTLSLAGLPNATAVVYAVSAPSQPLMLYVTTRTTTAKTTNIRSHPEVAFVIPVPRRTIPLFPPAAVQFQATATIVGSHDTAALAAFQSTWFHRRILHAEQRIVSQTGEMCFLAIRPHRALSTYGIGMSALSILRRPRQAISRVHIPPNR